MTNNNTISKGGGSFRLKITASFIEDRFTPLREIDITRTQPEGDCVE